jgi:hypothetical protein
MLTNLQILPSGAPGDASVVFDASAEQLAASSFAVSHHLRWRFGGEGLDVDETLAMRALVTVSDQLAGLVEAEAHGTVFVSAGGGQLLHEAVSSYLTMRDLESHQSVEERARLAVLRPLVVDLRELIAALEGVDGSDQPLCAA